MKNTGIIIIFIFQIVTSATIENFTSKAYDGSTYNLYDLLDEGKHVILFFTAKN